MLLSIMDKPIPRIAELSKANKKKKVVSVEG